MAIAELTGQRNSTGGAASTSVVFTYPSTPTQGNLLVAAFTWRGDTTVSAVPAGWTLATAAGNGSGLDGAIYYKIAGAGESTTPTWTLSVSNKFAGCASEWSGIAAAPLDKTNNNTGNSTAGTCGLTGTLSQANELIVAMFGNIDTYTWASHDNSSTEILEKASTGAGASSRNNTSLATRIVSATTSVNYGATLSTSGIWSSAVATFKADPNVTVALTGQSVSVARGSLGSSRTKAITGQSVSVSRGSLGSSRTKEITGQSLRVGKGMPDPTITKSFMLYSMPYPVQVSTPSPNALNAQVLTTKVSEPAAVVPTSITVALTGQTLSVTRGTLTASGGGGGPTTVDLTSATFNFDASTFQFTQTLKPTSAEFLFNAGDFSFVTGTTTIDLSSATLNFDPATIQLTQRLVPSAATFNFDAASPQFTQTLKPTSPTFNFDANIAGVTQGHTLTVEALNFSAYSVQLRQTIVPTAAALNLDAQTILNSLGLSLSSAGNINFDPTSVQLLQTIKPSSPTFWFTAHDMAYGAGARKYLEAATFTFTPSASQNTQTVSLGAATFSFNTYANDITLYLGGVELPGRLRLLPQIGVGL